MVDDEGELRVSLGNARKVIHLTGGEKHHGEARGFRCRPDPVRGTIGQPCGLVLRDVDPKAQNAGLLSPCRKAARGRWVVGRKGAHDTETPRISYAVFCWIKKTIV